MRMIFDTHAHYDDKAFDEDRDILLNSLPDKNIFAIVNVGADIESSSKAIELADKYDYIYAAVGIHPENIDSLDAQLDYMKELENFILNHKKVVAIGEIGLDYHFNSENKDGQKSLFEKQIQLAFKYDLPVIVHDRDAHGDTLEILKKYRPKGVVHCFSGSLEMAREIIKLGMYVGVGGVVTFKNAKNLVNVVNNIPISSMVLETDAPYLAPVPFRGKRCDSSHISHTAKKVAEIKNIDLSEVLEVTKKNAISLFDIR